MKKTFVQMRDYKPYDHTSFIASIACHVQSHNIITKGRHPLYIGIVQVGQHRSYTFGKSLFPWQYTLNLESIFTKAYLWSNMGVQNQTTGKFLKFIFTILHLVVVLLLLFQYRLAYLNNKTDLRNDVLIDTNE